MVETEGEEGGGPAHALPPSTHHHLPPELVPAASSCKIHSGNRSCDQHATPPPPSALSSPSPGVSGEVASTSRGSAYRNPRPHPDLSHVTSPVRAGTQAPEQPLQSSPRTVHNCAQSAGGGG